MELTTARTRPRIMPTSPSIIDTRRDQMFPVLEPFEIERVRRFGKVRSYEAGAALAKVGEVGLGLTIILAGQVEIARRDELGHSVPIVTYGLGSFMGELAQLSGRPTLIDAQARGPVEALVIPPDQLRALLIAEAELGERIMRALILRRVGLLETGAGGPVIVGRPGNGDVLRLEGFLRRNGHPRQMLDPEADPEAKALIERFHIDPGQLPIVLCPSGQLLRNPSEHELARCIGLVRPIDATRLYDVAIVGGRPCRPRSCGLCRIGRSVRSCARLPRIRRPGGRLGTDRELPRVSNGHHGNGADGARVQSGAKIRSRDGDPRRGDSPRC